MNNGLDHKATLKDIATKAGVSVTAASLVLNNRRVRISKEKRDRILQVAKQLDYRPNQVARNLAAGESRLIALIVPSIENLFFASLAKRLECECANDGYSLVVAVSEESRAKEHAVMNRLPALGVDGVFLVAARESYEAERELRKDAERVMCPVVLMDRLFSSSWCDGLAFDGYLGGRQASQRLVDAGHRRIGCVTDEADGEGLGVRTRGFVDVLQESGIGFDPALWVRGDYRFSSGYMAADRLIDMGVTAVFCGNDLMAAGFIQRVTERGLCVPADISVVGFDDVLEYYGLFRAVTSVAQDISQLAKRGWGKMREYIELLDSDDVGGCPWLENHHAELLKPHLVEHGTISDIAM